MEYSLEWYIFDLDGTLYDFWWTSFSRSRLGMAVMDRYLSIIRHNQFADPHSIYTEMVEIESRTGIWVSQQLADLIGLTRSEVLRMIWWPITPSTVIENYDTASHVFSVLKERWASLFLVTAAPKVWANNALDFMVIKHYFDQIYALEDYGNTKKEAFSQIQQKTGIKSSNFISIWDQMHSDIIPARELWMHTLHVTCPADLLKLL